MLRQHLSNEGMNPVSLPTDGKLLEIRDRILHLLGAQYVFAEGHDNGDT